MTNAIHGPSTLRLMTLNIVRSTRAPLPAWMVPARLKARTHVSLRRLLQEMDPHVLALQEVDAGTAGRLSFGATRVGDPDRHGTFLTSRAPVIAASTSRFRTQGTYRGKGFSDATFAIEGFRSSVRVVGVHLDPISRGRRKKQVAELVAHLGAHAGPLVILGDLNEDDVPGGIVPMLRDELGLTSRRPEAPTYDFLGIERTLDWILVSRHLAFEAYEVLPARLSDHRPVIAVVKEAAS
jgi:endonuclease/exonuclease/phosphatase family metal-dependent hydrolase